MLVLFETGMESLRWVSCWDFDLLVVMIVIVVGLVRGFGVKKFKNLNRFLWGCC